MVGWVWIEIMKLRRLRLGHGWLGRGYEVMSRRSKRENTDSSEYRHARRGVEELFGWTVKTIWEKVVQLSLVGY